MRCPECEAVIPEGCLCSVCDSDCFTIIGSGDVDGSPGECFQVVPIIDPDSDNLLACSATGLMAALPSYISDPPACNVFNSANISIPNDTATALTFNSERYDTDTMHSTVALTGRITFTTAGVYIVNLCVEFDKNAVGDRAAFIRKNGADFLGLDSVHAGDADLFVGLNVTVQEEFAAADYVEAVVKQDSGGALSVLALRESPIMSAVFRRRTT